LIETVKAPKPELVEFLTDQGLEKLEILQILNNLTRLNPALVYLIVENCAERFTGKRGSLSVKKFIAKVKKF
jgi:hypothetical protein